MKPSRTAGPWPYRVYVTVIHGLILTGLLFSVYLAYSHYRVHTDIAYQSFCAISQAINCDTVSQSPYSIFLNLPVPMWGLIGYAGLALLMVSPAMPAAGRKRGWAIGMLAAGGFCGVSFLLAGTSAFLIESYCIVCIATYAVNFLLVYSIWIIRRRFDCEPFARALAKDLQYLYQQSRITLMVVIAFLAVTVAVHALMPSYWEAGPLAEVSRNLPQGSTPEGLPWIGAEQPELEIIEFSDYQCFQCRKMHYFLRQLVARWPDKVRLIHCHYPMDHEFNFIVPEPFHVGSGRMALLAIHAKIRGKFWEMNDLLYQRVASGNTIELKPISEQLGLDLRELTAALEDDIHRALLGFQIRFGMKSKVLGTPSYLIDGQLYEGTIPAEILRRVTE